MKKRTVLPLILIGFLLTLVIMSCKKEDPKEDSQNNTNDNNTEESISIDSDTQFKINIDGDELSGISGEDGWASMISNDNSIATDPDTSEGKYGVSISKVDYFSIHIRKGTNYFIGTVSSDEKFKNFFSPGSYPYADDADDGIFIRIIDDRSGSNILYKTDGITQNGFFEIIESKEEEAFGNYYMKVHMKFECTVQDDAGNTMSITDGEFVARYENM